MDIITASVPVSPRSGATAQPDDSEDGDVDPPAPPAVQRLQSYVIVIMPPSGAGTCLVQVVATQVPAASNCGPAVMQGCPGAVHESGGARSARARVAPMANVATTTAMAQKR